MNTQSIRPGIRSAMLLCSVLFAATALADGQGTKPLSSYTLTFDDEFNSISVSDDGPANGTLWTDHLWYHKSAGGKNCYHGAKGPESPFSVKNGILSIIARKSADPSCPFKWTTGILVSVNEKGQGFTQTYGYFEMRAKLPKGRGLWPAFWMMNSAHIGNRAPHSEIDILEGQGSTPDMIFMTIHTHDATFQSKHKMIRRDISGENWQNVDNAYHVKDTTSSFHTYGVYWGKSRITFYFDRVALNTIPTPADFNQPMYIICNLELGGWSGLPDNTTPNPSTLEVDYIRAYSAEATAHAVAPNPETDSSFKP